MSVPNKRKENESPSKGISPKKQKQSENEYSTFTDREVEAFLCHLSDEKLLDVVMENKRSLRIASRIIERQFRFEYLYLSNKIALKNVGSVWSIEFLKLFSNEIKWLKLIYKEEYHHFNHVIEKVVFDHCTDSLEKIHLMNAGRFSMFEIDKPFKHVTEAILETGTICSPFSNIAEWFPKLKTLKLIDLQLHSISDDKRFGNRLCFELETLEIENLKSKNGDNVYMNEIAVLVQSCPNLNYISIVNQDDVDELLAKIAELNPNLPNIYLDLYLRKPVGTAAIHFESLKRLDFNSSEHTLNIATDEIGHLYIFFYGECFDEQWLGLIENNKNMRKITVHSEWESDEIESKFINLVKTSTRLKEVLVMKQFSADQIKDLVSCCSTLNKIGFDKRFDENSDEETLKAIFDSFEPKWKLNLDVSPSYPYFCFEKMNAQ